MPNTSLLQIDSRACAYRFQHYLATVREAHWGYANGPTPGMRQLTRPAGRQQTTEGIGEIITNLSQSLMNQCFNASLCLHCATVEDPATQIVPQL